MSIEAEANNRMFEDTNMKTTESQVNFETKEENLHFEGVFDIDPRELHQKLSDVHLVDVRHPEEFTGELGHIPASKLIVLDTLEQYLSQLPKDKPTVFICRSGSRSARACSLAREAGMREVYNLKGGMILWNELHFKTEI